MADYLFKSQDDEDKSEFRFYAEPHALSHMGMMVVIYPTGYWFPLKKIPGGYQIQWKHFDTSKHLPKDLKNYMDKVFRLMAFA